MSSFCHLFTNSQLFEQHILIGCTKKMPKTTNIYKFTRCRTWMNYLVILPAIIGLVGMFTTTRQSMGSTTTRIVSEEPRLNTIVFSSFVEAFPDATWMVKLAIESYIRSFHINRSTSILSFRIQCLDLRTPFGKVEHSRWQQYIDNVESIAEWSKQFFVNVSIQCAETLAAAYCSALYQDDYPFYFFLEHDWFFIPQMINHTMGEFLPLLKDPAMSYIRFSKARNHRNCMENADTDPLALRAMESVDLRIPLASDYTFSQNPHVASASTVRLLADATCRIHPPVSHLEFERILTHNCQRSYIGAKDYDFKCSNCDCSIMKKFRPCRFFVYGNKDVEQTVFHMDGRWMHEYKSANGGLFFGSVMREHTELFIRNETDSAAFITMLGDFIVTHFAQTGPGETFVGNELWTGGKHS